MNTSEVLEQFGERLRRQETAEPRPTLWEVWSVSGAIADLTLVAPITNPLRIYNLTGRTLTLIEVFASVGTAPNVNPIILDVNMNGATVFAAPGDRPTIGLGTNTATATPTGTTLWPDGSYLTVDVDQVDTPGGNARDLTVQVVHHA